MQTQDESSRSSDPLSHPTSTEWMAFLYKETASTRRREMGKHLAHCPECARQVQAWRASLDDLDEWIIPVSRPAPQVWLPLLKWAAAAALFLCVGILSGQAFSPSHREVAALKASVTELSEKLNRSGGNVDLSASVDSARSAASAETLRLLAQYSAVQDNLRTADQLALKDVLDSLELRLGTLRSELETVAVNTEGGFQQTRQNLAQLVSSPPSQ